jgi:hypothetical protein
VGVAPGQIGNRAGHALKSSALVGGRWCKWR